MAVIFRFWSKSSVLALFMAVNCRLFAFPGIEREREREGGQRES